MAKALTDAPREYLFGSALASMVEKALTPEQRRFPLTLHKGAWGNEETITVNSRDQEANAISQGYSYTHAPAPPAPTEFPQS